MKEQKLFDAITNLPDSAVTEAAIPKPKKKRFKKWMIPAIAAVLALVYTLGSAIWPDGATFGMVANAAYIAEYPDRAQAAEAGTLSYQEDLTAWINEQQVLALPKDFDTSGINRFTRRATLEFFGSNRDQNRVYSPISVYMALCMLAEITDTTSREQILELLGTGNIDSLRAEANTLWNNVYRNDGKTTALLANSMWLRKDTKYVDETLKTLAENYYASSFEGQMGSASMNSALQDWMNENTNGLLKDQISDIKLNADTVIALVSTVYYKGIWGGDFNPQRNTVEPFHAVSGDTDVTFMNQSTTGYYYWSEKFAAMRKSLSQSGMWLVLPDEGVSPEELLEDDSFWDMVQVGRGVERTQLIIDLSLPKFDITDQMDLTQTLKDLGVTEVFTEEPYLGDFSPLTRDPRWEEIYVNQAIHGARLKIDEEGCEGAAYTVISATGSSSAPPTDRVELRFDRPFVFVLTNTDNIPLFIGIVHNP